MSMIRVEVTRTLRSTKLLVKYGGYSVPLFSHKIAFSFFSLKAVKMLHRTCMMCHRFGSNHFVLKTTKKYVSYCTAPSLSDTGINAGLQAESSRHGKCEWKLYELHAKSDRDWWYCCTSKRSAGKLSTAWRKTTDDLFWFFQKLFDISGRRTTIILQSYLIQVVDDEKPRIKAPVISPRSILQAHGQLFMNWKALPFSGTLPSKLGDFLCRSKQKATRISVSGIRPPAMVRRLPSQKSDRLRSVMCKTRWQILTVQL